MRPGPLGFQTCICTDRMSRSGRRGLRRETPHHGRFVRIGRPHRVEYAWVSEAPRVLSRSYRCRLMPGAIRQRSSYVIPTCRMMKWATTNGRLDLGPVEAISAEAAIKLLYLVLRRVSRNRKIPQREWTAAMTQFAILFGERFRCE
jgi:hypothetical protein